MAGRRIDINISGNAAGFSGAAAKVGADTNKMANGFRQVTASSNMAGSSIQKTGAISTSTTSKLNAGSRGAKGLAFGLIGITSAGVEAIGMLTMYNDTQRSVKEAQQEVTRALAESGEGSRDYKNAVMDLAKAERFGNMTRRNLILSTFDLVPFTLLTINAIAKLISTHKAAKTATDALAVANEAMTGSVTRQLAAINGQSAAAAASSISMKSWTGSTQAANVAAITSTGSFTNQSVAMGRGAAMADTATIATTRLSKAMRVLQIAMKIAIPLVLLEIGSQAFANNWGGFADKINQVGVAIGNAVPQLKGFLGYVDKIGRSIVAIFTGDFESIGSIWNPVVEGGEEAVKVTEAMEKKLDEMREQIFDVTRASSEMMNEIALGEKKDLKKFLKDIGVTTGKTQFDDAKKGAKEYFEALETGITNLQNVGKQLQTLRNINLMEKFGINIDPDVIRKIRYSMEDKLRNAFEGDKGSIFEKLADVIEKNAKKSAPKFNAAIAQFASDTPGLINLLNAAGLGDLADEIEAIINDQKLGEVAGKAISNSFTTASILDPNSGKTKDKFFGTMEIGKDIGKAAGPFQPIIDDIKTGIAGIKAAIETGDWKSIGAALRTALSNIVTAENSLLVGQAIHTYIIKPAYNAAYPFGFVIGQAIRDGWAQFKKDPVNSILGTADAISKPPTNFLVGLFGFKTEDEMGQWFQNAMRSLFSKNPALLMLRRIINDPVGGIIAFLKGEGAAESRFDTKAGSGQVSIGTILNKDKNLAQIIGEWFTREITKPIQDSINTAWTTISGFLNNNKWINLFLTGKIIEGFKDLFSHIKVVGSGIISTITESAEWTWIVDNIVTPIMDKVNTAVTTLTTWYNGLTELGKTIISYVINGSADIAKILGSLVNTAEAAGPVTTGPKNSVDIKITANTAGAIASFNGLGTNFSQNMANISQNSRDASTAINNEFTIMWEKAVGIFNSLGTWFMKNMIVIQEQASIGANGVINNMTAMWEKVVEIFESIATHSSTNMQGVMNNGAAAAKNIIKEFDAMVKKANSAFVKLANNFEKAMKNIAHNAAVAASKANKSLASIKNRTVTITYEEKGAVPKSKGGIVPFAEGGVISARGGLTTSNGPTYLYGDNSGGRETLAFLPHDGNKADKIMDQLDTMFGRRKSMTLVGGNGDRDIIIPITVNINGEQYSFTKKYRVRQNQEIASQVF